jgi:hypothetical protein
MGSGWASPSFPCTARPGRRRAAIKLCYNTAATAQDHQSGKRQYQPPAATRTIRQRRPRGQTRRRKLAVLLGPRQLGGTMALVDVLDSLPTTHADYQNILNIYKGVVVGLKATQDSSTGLWWQGARSADRFRQLPGDIVQRHVRLRNQEGHQ